MSNSIFRRLQYPGVNSVPPFDCHPYSEQCAAELLKPEDNCELLILMRKTTMSNCLVSSEFQHQGKIANKNAVFKETEP